jgi:phenylacetate-CoA ligase
MNNLARDQGYFDPETETLSEDRRTERLTERLRNFLTRAAAEAPSVKAGLDEAGLDPAKISGPADLAKLPLLRRDDLKQRQQTDPPFGGFPGGPEVERIYILAGALLVPGRKSFIGGSLSEALFAAGVRPGDRVINAFNYHYWPYAHMLDEALGRMGAVCLPMGAGNAGLLVNLMHALKPEGFIGTPSFLMSIAQRAESLGLDPKDDLGLAVGAVGAEMLPPKMRRRLERKLGVVIRQHYAIAEMGCLGYECPVQHGLHVPDDVIVEVVHPETGLPVEPGQVGEVVATAFNPVFPLIRLATGDLSAWVTEPCDCGRTAWRLKGIMGRTDQATKVKGTFIHPWQMDEILRPFPEVINYQAVITRPGELDKLTLYVELKRSATADPLLAGRLEKALQEGLAVKGDVEIVDRGTIPEFSGKIEDKRKWDE